MLALALGIATGPSWLLRPADGQETEQRFRLGDEVCLECHNDLAPLWESLRHNQYLNSESLDEAERGCEGCHGPGSAHIEDPEAGNIEDFDDPVDLPPGAPCLKCHETMIAPGHWQNSAHADAGLTCAACHAVHAEPKGPSLLKLPRTELCLSCHEGQNAEFRMNSHHPVLEGRLDCTDCHNVHEEGPGTERLLKQGNDLCLECHVEKRGPFVWEHQTSMGDGEDTCLTCHLPHGSPNPNLQELFGRALCLQCHTDIAADPAHQARRGDCWRSGCHNRIHGSNVNRLFIN